MYYEEFLNKSVKIIYVDGSSSIRALRGILQACDSNFVLIGRRDGRDILLKASAIQSIQKQKEEGEKENGEDESNTCI